MHFGTTIVLFARGAFPTPSSMLLAISPDIAEDSVPFLNTDRSIRRSTVGRIRGSVVIAIDVSDTYGSFLTALRYAAFHVASIITTTGFATYDYNFWPQFSETLLVILFFVGGCAGSAGGGIKVSRVGAMISLARNTIKKRLHPNAVVPLKLGDTTVDQSVMLSIAGFVGAYIITGLAGTLIYSLSGYDFETCFTASFLLLGNIGIGMGAVGPSGNFSIFSDAILTAGSFLMLVGRLELFTVFALFTRGFWKK